VKIRPSLLHSVAVAIAIAFVAIVPAGHAASKSATEQKPNLVFFLGEGLRFDEFTSAGNTILSTPNMDRIGREGFTSLHPPHEEEPR
jgi:hypothetical protein